MKGFSLITHIRLLPPAIGRGRGRENTAIMGSIILISFFLIIYSFIRQLKSPYLFICDLSKFSVYIKIEIYSAIHEVHYY